MVDYPMEYGHMGGYGMMGYGWPILGWVFMILFWAALILAVIWLYKQVRGPEKAPAALETPLDVLKKRYAAGEISKEQFDAMKKDIE
jgi:putative membrane protein